LRYKLELLRILFLEGFAVALIQGIQAKCLIWINAGRILNQPTLGIFKAQFHWRIDAT